MDVVLFNQKKIQFNGGNAFSKPFQFKHQEGRQHQSCLKACLCCSFGDALPFLQEG